MAVGPNDPPPSTQSSPPQPSEGERRKIPRLQPSNLSVSVKYRGLLSKMKRSGTVKTLDYNRFGLAFEADHNYRIGDELLFTITYKETQIINIVGFICNSESTNDSTRFGIQFDFSANKHMRSTSTEQTLIALETAIS